MRNFIRNIKAKFQRKNDDLNEFDIKSLIPKSGRLKSKIFENKFLKIPATLFYEIEILFEPFKTENELNQTIVQLNFIRLNTRKIKNLENSEFHFPINPDDGYVDGSIYLFDVHNPFDVTKMTFGKIVNSTIELKLEYNIIFEFEGTGYSNSLNNTLTLKIALDKLNIDTAIIGVDNITDESVKAIAGKFVDLEDFLEPDFDKNNISIKYKNGI